MGVQRIWCVLHTIVFTVWTYVNNKVSPAFFIENAFNSDVINTVCFAHCKRRSHGSQSGEY